LDLEGTDNSTDTMLATESVSTVSTGIQKLRELISENKDKDNIYGRAANGTFPLVINVENEVATTQYSVPIPTNILPVRYSATDQNQARFSQRKFSFLWRQRRPTCKSSHSRLLAFRSPALQL
jgi:hypothetical protein